MVVLSGPSFAIEVAQQLPTAILAASDDPRGHRAGPAGVSRPVLPALWQRRCDRRRDRRRRLKNIIAIAAGVVEGLGLGHNALAALITRGLAELTRLACAAGRPPRNARRPERPRRSRADVHRKPEPQSPRGIELARGRTLAEILAAMKMVAEGVNHDGRRARARRAVRRRAADRDTDGGSAQRADGRPHGDRCTDAAQAACGGRNGATRRRGDGVIDRRRFLAGGLGATLLASLPADLWAGTAQAPAPAAWDPGRVVHLLPTVSDTAMLIKASFTRPLTNATDAANRGAERSRARERHATAVLAVPCDRPGPGPPIHAFARGGGRHVVVRAVGPGDVSGRRRAARAVPGAVLQLCRRTRAPAARIPSFGDSPSPVASRAFVRAAGRRRQRRSRVLGSAGAHAVAGRLVPRRKPSGLPDDSTARRSCSATPTRRCSSSRRDRRSCRCTARTSDRRLCSSCRTITTTSTTTRRPTKSSRFRRRRSCCSWRARRSGCTTRSSCPMPAGRAACPGRRRGIGDCGVRELRDDSVRTPGGDQSLRRAAHRDAGRAERGVRRSGSRAVAARARGIDRRDASGSRAVESARLERRQMGRVVSGRARGEQEADHRRRRNPTGNPAGFGSTIA